MTNIPGDIARLRAIDRELCEIGERVKLLIPERPERDDLTQTAWNDLGGAVVCVRCAISSLNGVVKEVMP